MMLALLRAHSVRQILKFRLHANARASSREGYFPEVMYIRAAAAFVQLACVVWREHAECRRGLVGNNLGPGD
eukprot:253401-Pleurochrysis_carterae.AAC.1